VLLDVVGLFPFGHRAGRSGGAVPAQDRQLLARPLPLLRLLHPHLVVRLRDA
jgi:hypothetical protein